MEIQFFTQYDNMIILYDIYDKYDMIYDDIGYDMIWYMHHWSTVWGEWYYCRMFLEWAESTAGAARIAIELKSLRSTAAGRKVAELAGSAEGKEGLMRGLAEALQNDPSLRLQLGALLH